MSGGTTAAVYTLAAVAAAGTAYSVYEGERSAAAQERAQNQAKESALKQEQQADQAMNKANQKKPDTASALSSAQQSGKAGASGTMLTGPTGVDPNQLSLGKSTLLGL